MLGAGRNQMPIAAMAAAMGGNVRVGLEDWLWVGPGKLATATPSRCARRARSSRGSGSRSRRPDEAREILELKGGDRVAF